MSKLVPAPQRAADPEIVPALTAGEQAYLARLEGVVERGIETFRQVAAALWEIHDRRLYRDGFPSFEAYCNARWGWSREHCGRLDAGGILYWLRQAEVILESQMLPIRSGELGRLRQAGFPDADTLAHLVLKFMNRDPLSEEGDGNAE